MALDKYCFLFTVVPSLYGFVTSSNIVPLMPLVKAMLENMTHF